MENSISSWNIKNQIVILVFVIKNDVVDLKKTIEDETKGKKQRMPFLFLLVHHGKKKSCEE